MLSVVVMLVSLFSDILSFVKLSVIKLRVIKLRVIKLRVIKLSVIKLCLGTFSKQYNNHTKVKIIYLCL
jgi:hypothetical protein